MGKKHYINAEKLERELNRFAAYVQYRNYEQIGTYSNHHQVTGFRNRFNPNHKDFTSNAERVLFDIYCGDDDEAAFKQAIETFGAKYDLIVYLFFIKNPEKYLLL